MLPHSKVCNDIEFLYKNITVLTHPVQGHPLRNGGKKVVFHSALSYPEIVTGNTGMPRAIKKVGLLLNGFSLNGIFCTDYSSYIDGIVRIHQWCSIFGIELAIRSRPSNVLSSFLVNALGVERSSIDGCTDCSIQTFSQGVDLCLMYDSPTSGAIEFLKLGIPILNTVPMPLSASEVVWINNFVVPRLSVEETLSRLLEFHLDENIWHKFSRNQSSMYLRLFDDSYGLRYYL
jgi:hypothetical protein